MKDTARKALNGLYSTSVMDTWLGRHTLPVLGYRAIELWLSKPNVELLPRFFRNRSHLGYRNRQSASEVTARLLLFPFCKVLP